MHDYLIAFGLTLAVEGAVAAALGIRTLHGLAAILAVNLITHPVFYHSALWGVPEFLWRDYYTSLLIAEVLIAVVEAALLKYAPSQRTWAEVLTVSFLMNSGSFLTGVAFW